MAISREDYIKKFKKLSNLNEAVIRPATSMDGEDDVPFASGVVSPGSSPEERTSSTAFDPSSMFEADGAAPNDELPLEPVDGAEAQPPAGGAGMDSSSPEAQFDQQAGAATGGAEQPPAPEAQGTEPNPASIDDPNLTTTGGEGQPQAASNGQDEVQNLLLKTQLSAIEKMSSKFDEIEANIQGLNAQLARYGAEVEKVKEPTPVEKVEKRWQDSYPFKYTLNDLWNGNTFQGNHDLFPKQQDGIRQTSDGKFEMNAEDAMNLSDFDIKKSFNEEVERLQKKINESLAKKK